MFIEDGVRHKLWVTLDNPFDYAGFCQKCVDNDISPMDGLDFAFKVGMIMLGRTLFPGLSDLDATNRVGTAFTILNIHPYAHRPKKIEELPGYAVPQERSCCGGGKIL